MSKAIVRGKFVGQSGGNFPVDAETFQQLQDYVDAVAELSNMYIPSAMSGAILSGCELESSGTRRGSGWVVLSGEGLVYFEGGLVANGLSVVEDDIDVVVGGVTYPAYSRKRAVAGMIAGSATYRWDAIADRTNIYDVKNDAMPIGSIVLYGGDATQLSAKWLPCDGRTVSSAEYSELYIAIGTRYNGGQSLSGAFKLPSLGNLITGTSYVIRAK